ncbi:hypothetical protein D9757_009873 [Collybiopsis confluens]|uniref:Heterokaryon incompatibility domain-containing protein n=1 Tax=Collybiopsis confluens TaxID=2823264 RepID=A0A8H5GTV2_9AGAR|nr:hypothetical protein D9757_009873 [Collybiopsis confluens]
MSCFSCLLPRLPFTPRKVLAQSPSYPTYDEELKPIPGGQLIFHERFPDIINTTLDIAQRATPRRFRLVDCYQLIHKNELCIYEFETFPTVPYAPLSYVWRGRAAAGSDWKEDLGTFSVKGAEDGDPISLDVLKTVSQAVSLGRQFPIGPFLWVDRLCILQTDKSDKAWQISHMFKIYKSCMVCVILPGGIRHLARLDEETDWIHRGWTLQESLAPEKVIVLFLFSRNFFEGDDVDKVLENCENYGDQTFAPIQQVDSEDSDSHKYLKAMKKFGRAAWVPLDSLLDASTDNPRWQLTRMPPPEDMINNPAILGGYTECDLLQMARTASTVSYQGRQEWREQAIWRSSFIRTSSRPVDMIFSIMQLFDVNLDTTKFKEDNRLGATIALASEILQRGKTASWLGSLFTLDSCPQICTFPYFPKTSVSGKAMVSKNNGDEVEMIREMEKIPTYRWLDKVPGGRMDEAGYFIFTSPAVRITRVPNAQAPGVDQYSGTKEIDGFMHFAAEDESSWRIYPEASDIQKLDKSPRTFMVFLGKQVAHISSIEELEENEGESIVLVVEEHAPERFHKISCYLFSESSSYLIRQGMERQFYLGGPEAF